MQNLNSARWLVWGMRILIILCQIVLSFKIVAQNFGVGTLTPESKFHVKNTSDIPVLIVDASSTQSNTNPLIRLRSSNGVDLLWLNSDNIANIFIGNNTGRVAILGPADNTFIGSDAGYTNGGGVNNSVLGYKAYYSNASGNENVTMGYSSLYANYNNISIYNVAFGDYALFANETSSNSACGSNALRWTITGKQNVAVGYRAGFTYSYGDGNVFIGAEADATNSGLTEMVAIGNIATCTASYQARIGNSSTISIGGFADWTIYSDARIKRNKVENVPGLDFICQLQPVTYQLDVSGLSDILHESRGREMPAHMQDLMHKKEQIIQSGFVAQDVEALARSLNFDFNGIDPPKNENDLYGLRYAQFVVPLVKAVQELNDEINRYIDENERLKYLRSELDELQKRIESYTSQIQE